MTRTINFGADATDADYQIRDTSETGGDLIIEHLPSGATFEYDATENAWVPTDPIGTDARPVPGVVSDSVSTSEINKTYIIDDNVSDLGDELNQYDSNVPEGSVIHIPRGDWDWSTTFTPSKNLVLRGDHILADNLNLGTVAQRQADVKLIEPDDGVGIAIDAIEFRDMVSGSSTGIELHGTSWLRDVTLHSFGDPALYLHSNSSSSNLNQTLAERLRLVSLRGDGVRIENTGGPVDVNALNIDIRAATNIDGRVVDQIDGWGSKFHCTLAESIGASNSGTVYNIEGTHSEWSITYAENTGTLFEFGGGGGEYNYATFSQTVGADARTNNSGDNVIHAMGSADPLFDKTSGRLEIASPLDASRYDWVPDSPETTQELHRIVHPDANENPVERSTYTSDVGTSATAIHDTLKPIGVVYVMGRTGGNYSLDEVSYDRNDEAQNNRELITRGTPPSRTYSVDGTNDNLELAVSSGSVDTIVKSALEGLPGSP